MSASDKYWNNKAKKVILIQCGGKLFWVKPGQALDVTKLGLSKTKAKRGRS